MADSGSGAVQSPGEFGSSFKAFLDAAVAAAPDAISPLGSRLRDHLAVEPRGLPIVALELPVSDHPNLQIALDEIFRRNGWSSELIGIGGDLSTPFSGPGLAAIAGPARSIFSATAFEPGPVRHVSLDLGGARAIQCVANGLYLISSPGGPLAAVAMRQENPMHAAVRMEVTGADEGALEAFVADVRATMTDRNVYRGRAISLTRGQHGEVNVQVESLPTVERDRIVLPDGVLDRVERHVLAPARHRDRLLAAHRHLKRGLLLYGPPGTGKTLTTMYLIGRMPDRTVFLLTGEGMHAIEPACRKARSLQPSMVVLEDVDLIAQERTFPGAVTPILFELLNQMDGLADDADVVFLLTSNRPDLLEPALAARPGRIDQAIELPFPSANDRLRLIRLYAEGMDVAEADLDRVAARTEGASAALIKELLRRAAVLAADESPDGLVVREAQLDTALDELVSEGGALNQTLFGTRATSGQ